MKGRKRLIVALDLPNKDDAIKLIEELDGVVSFFKIGLQLFASGQWLEVLETLNDGEKEVFLDLKIPDDIGNTIRSVVEVCVSLPAVKFVTLSAQASVKTIQAAREGRGQRENPKFLTVPYLSSLDEKDLKEVYGMDDLTSFITDRAKKAIDAGCDGLIASGDAIAQLRGEYPDLTIVSPGIRPAGSSADDHKRLTTPTDAIRMGADYLVVGRPIRQAPDPKKMAESIIAEIERAEHGTSGSASGYGENSGPQSMVCGPSSDP